MKEKTAEIFLAVIVTRESKKKGYPYHVKSG
jgi:hypothetical protein